MRISLIGILVVLLTILINISAIHTNRLKSDSMHFQDNMESMELTQEKDEMIDQAKLDLYRDEYGYYSMEGNYHKLNEKTEYPRTLSMFSLNELPAITDRMYLVTDLGDYYTGNLPNSEWIYDEFMTEPEYDASNGLEFDLTEGFKYYIKDFSIEENDTYWLEQIYNIELFSLEEITTETYIPNLNGKPKIILKVKDNSIVSYNIVNMKIKDFQFLKGYNLKGEEIMKIERNFSEEVFEIPTIDGIRYILLNGHKISFSIPKMNYINFSIENPYLVTVNRDFDITEFYNFDGNEYIDIDFDAGYYSTIEFILYDSQEEHYEMEYLDLILEFVSGE